MILITGASGLIGSAVVRELNARGYTNLLLVDHLGQSDKWMNLRSLRFADYMEKDALLRLLIDGASQAYKVKALQKIHTIIHLGACSSTTEKDATYLIENNFEYSKRLSEFAAKRKLRMVYASSAATYGDGANGYVDDESLLHTLRPLNAYGYSKQIFDQYLDRRGFGDRFVGLKYFNVFGPNEYHKGDMQSLVLKAFRQIQSEGKLRLFRSYKAEYKDGEQKRDFLYVSDAAKVTVYFALDSQVGGIFNVGSGTANTWLELAGAIFSAMGRPANVEFIDMPESMRDKYQYYTCAPLEKLRAAGYAEPITALDEAVRDYVTNCLMQGERRL